MKCKICGSENVKVAYKGLIRDGGLGNYTKEPVIMWQCMECNIIWHDLVLDNVKYYESQDYRKALEGTSEEEEFYHLHDKDNLDKLQYTGTQIFRHSSVADIGCGCGAFLDFVKGVADRIIAIEPSETYRKVMTKKGFDTYAYAKDAKSVWGGGVDVITSFDVIEHVEEPREFLQDVYDLLSPKGQAIIGTPTDAPVMRELLGEIYEKNQLFSTQHPWIFGEKNLRLMVKEIGFKNIDVKFFQRYGVGNLIGWLRDKKPKSDVHVKWITETMDEVWKKEIAELGLADYIVIYLQK